MAGIQNLEAAFGKAANQLYQGLLDLNTPPATITQRVNQVLSMRSSLLNMYGVPQQAVGKGKAVVQWPQQWQGNGAGWQGQGAEEAESSVVDWKSKLINLVSKRGKRSLTKGEMVYEACEAEGGFAASVTCPMLQQQYAGDEVAPSKKQAEQAAAKAAIAAEFPNELGMGMAAPAAAWGGKGKQGWGALAFAGGCKGAPAFAAGTKRPLASAVEERDNKSTLIHSMQMLLQRPVQKGDIEFDTKLVDENNPQGGYVSHLTLPSYDQQAAWEGAQGEGKKQAEQNAAGQALAALQQVIGSAEEAYKAKRARLRKEKAAQQAAKTAGAAEGLAEG